MAIVQISKIIQKQGNLADLPQLDTAEIGYATDSKRLFIGDELPSSPDPTLLYNTEILTENSVDGTSIIYDPVTGVISSVGGGGGGGTVTSVNVSGGNTGLTTTGGPILTFGTITLGGVLSVEHGGTGSNTSNGALYNILPDVANNDGKYLYTDGANIIWEFAAGSLPDQTNNAGKFLTTDGSNASWANVTGGTANVAGSNSEIQFNMGGQLAASSNLIYDVANDVFQVGNLSLTSYIESGNGQNMVVSANQALTLQSINQDITVSLPSGNTHKITISGPSAGDYANNLTDNDLVNKYYVDQNSGSGNTGVTQIVAGTNITISPIDGTGAVTINSSGGSVPIGPPINNGNVFVDNNSHTTVTFVPTLTRLPILVIWIEIPTPIVDPPAITISPQLVNVTSSGFTVVGGGSGGTVYYAYW